MTKTPARLGARWTRSVVLTLGAALNGWRGRGSPSGKRSDQLLGGVVAPGAGLAQDTFSGVFNGDPHKLIRSLPGSNLPYVTPFITALREIGDEE